ncbi:hypothetical protein CLU83_1753 [Flavobacterium sp. 1]|uniref:hypothetical protein n=1 Tax=Flavobacterium sp. 1 TaxID=2035200 RepID=UPI000C23CE10|nr:hypothetical protein [Flavobacterium sp. 1]PJJ08479.1 hypothetical protein CLU83_1753 [Flavobacterium sp. 1]
MLNEKDFFWKNFRLGTELQNSGTFIYNGIFHLDNIEYFRFEEECFEFLYNISVGIERLEKILIILIEHDNKNKSQEEFEKSLITHNHLELLKRIKAERQLNFGKTHIKFLVLLANFYKSVRYERFNISSVYKPSQEKEKLVEFIISELKVELTEGPQNLLENTEQVKNFLGKLIDKISTTLYDLIKIEARRIGTFTHEIRYNSKAYKIFTEKEFDFKNEKLMQREVLLFLLKKFPKDELKKFIDSIEPLPFEQYHTNQYIESILNIHKDGSVKDEMLSIYEDERPSKNRLNDILAIGSDFNFEYFGKNEEDDFEE